MKVTESHLPRVQSGTPCEECQQPIDTSVLVQYEYIDNDAKIFGFVRLVNESGELAKLCAHCRMKKYQSVGQGMATAQYGLIGVEIPKRGYQKKAE